MKKMMNWMAMAMLFVCPLFTSCDDGDDDNTTNPVEKNVVANKKATRQCCYVHLEVLIRNQLKRMML